MRRGSAMPRGPRGRARCVALGPRGAVHRGMPRLPGAQRLEPGRLALARGFAQWRLRALHRPGRRAASRLRFRSHRQLRHPAHDRPGDAAARADSLPRLCGRVRPRSVSDPARAARDGRGRIGSPRARRPARHLPAVRALRRAAGRSGLGGGLRRALRPAHRRPAAARLDVGRRGRAADRARPCARRRGPRRTRSATRCASRCPGRAGRSALRRGTSPRARATRACRRWACGCG